MKLEKSLKVILAVLAIGVLLNAFSPIISAKSALAAVDCNASYGISNTPSSDYMTSQTHFLLCEIDEKLSFIHSVARDITYGYCKNKKICDGR